MYYFLATIIIIIFFKYKKQYNIFLKFFFGQFPHGNTTSAFDARRGSGDCGYWHASWVLVRGLNLLVGLGFSKIDQVAKKKCMSQTFFFFHRKFRPNFAHKSQGNVKDIDPKIWKDEVMGGDV